MRSVLYLTRNGLLEPLGQSQITPYLKGLSASFSISIISFEKPCDMIFVDEQLLLQDQFSRLGIAWFPFVFRSKPRTLAPLCGVLLLGAFSFLTLYRKRRSALVHARSYLPAAIALFLNKLLGVPFIFDMRGLWPEELITAGRLRRGTLLHHSLLCLERTCLRESSGVVLLTHAALDYLTALYPRELLHKRVEVIPTCVDLKRFKTPLSYDDPFVIGCIGTVLSGWFLLDWLRAFFAALLRVVPSARLELISRDDPTDILRLINPPSSWSNRLTIKSARPSQMPALIQAHTASVMFYAGGATSELGRSPTRMAEVLGCGRPVVACGGVGDVEQIIANNRVGVLAGGPSDNQMDACVLNLLSLLNDPQLSLRCRLTAEKLFSLDSGIAAYHRLYDDIHI